MKIYENLKRYRIIPYGPTEWAIEVYCYVTEYVTTKKCFFFKKKEKTETYEWVTATWHYSDYGRGSPINIKPSHKEPFPLATIEIAKNIIDSVVDHDKKVLEDGLETIRRQKEIAPLEYP